MEKSVKVGIITGVAASMVFVYLLDPIIKVFGEFIVYSSEYVANGLIDTIYAKPITIIVSILFCLFLSLC